MFYTYYNKPKVVYSESGSPNRILRQLQYDEDVLDFVLKDVGVINQYEEIQSYRESTDLAIILRNIDKNALNGMVSSFDVGDIENLGVSDFTQLPTSYADILNLQKKATNVFNGLDEDIRKEFNYNPTAFVNSFATPQFNEIMDKVYKKRGIFKDNKDESSHKDESSYVDNSNKYKDKGGKEK